MAGIPPLNGFLSKELMLEEAAHTVWLTPWADGPAGHPRGAVLGRLQLSAFWPTASWGPGAATIPTTPHDPGPGLWGAPALLALLVVLIGLFPMLTAAWLVDAAAAAVTGEAVHRPDQPLARAGSRRPVDVAGRHRRRR